MGKISKNGRSNNRDRFFAVPHYILNTPAWKQFSVSARATWLEFGRVHNGLNNGRIAMSARFLGDRLGLSHDSAAKAIRELVTFGFLEVTRALADLIEPGRVIFGAHTNAKEQLLVDLASRAAASLNLDPKLLCNGSASR
jgi:hypothetical protein